MKVRTDNASYLAAQERRKRRRIALFLALIVLTASAAALVFLWTDYAERSGRLYPAAPFSEGPRKEWNAPSARDLSVPFLVSGAGCTILLPERPKALPSGNALLKTSAGEVLIGTAPREGWEGAAEDYAALSGMTATEAVYERGEEGYLGERKASMACKTLKASFPDGRRGTVRIVFFKVELRDGPLFLFGVTRHRNVSALFGEMLKVLGTIHETKGEGADYVLIELSAASEGGAAEGAETGGEEGGADAPMDEELGEGNASANPNGIHEAPMGELLKKSGEATLSMPGHEGEAAFSFYHAGLSRLYEITLKGPDGREFSPERVIEGEGFEYVFLVETPEAGEWTFFYRGEERIGTYAVTWVPSEAFVPLAERTRGKGGEDDEGQ